jgi:hypothetical protein
LVLQESVIAAIEVKSILGKKDLQEQIADIFRALPSPQPLKVVVALALQNQGQHRRLVASWAEEAH